MSDVFVFADEDEPVNEQGSEQQSDSWKILIVDDDESVHQVTRLALKRVALDERPLEFISAYSGREAKEQMQAHDDIALVLLDIVMETDNAGFDVANFIRHELGNHTTRIILRTGQPGEVPEKDVILNYEIDGYKTKSELTSQALYSVILTSLRSYRDLCRVKENNRRLDQIVSASSDIFEQQSIESFVGRLLFHLKELVGCECDHRERASFVAEIAEGEVTIISDDGSMNLTPGPAREQLSEALWSIVEEVRDTGESVYRQGHLLLFGRSASDKRLIVYLSDVCEPDGGLWHILHLFTRNFETAYANLLLSIENENHRRYLEIRVQERTRQLIDTRDKLFEAEKMASIGQLAAGVAHEINNPLGFIKSNLAMVATSFKQLLELLDYYRLLEHKATADQIEQLRKLLVESDLDYLREEVPAVVSETDEGVGRIRRIVSDLRDFASWKSGDLNVQPLNPLLKAQLEMVSPELRTGVEIDCQLNEELSLPLMPEQFAKAVSNIMVNAFEALDNQGRFRLWTRKQGDQVEIHFEDTGKGIDPEQHGRIFDPFYTTKDIGNGTGLGLSLSYGVVKLHGGSIDVHSEPASGTEFVIRLPLLSQESLDSACL